MSAAALPSARGWCPGVLRPMPTGDGLLVRVHPQAGRLTASQLRAIAEAARNCGNGTVEVSSRANVQIRGVRKGSHGTLVRLLDRVGLADAPGGGPYRPCTVSPLAGLEGEAFDSFVLASAINDALGADDSLANLPAKFGVIVDGEGRFPLDEVTADIRVAVGPRADAAIIGIPDGPRLRWLGPVQLNDAVAAVHRLAAALAQVLRDRGSGRMRDLALAVIARAALPFSNDAPMARARDAAPVGAVDYGTGGAVLLGLPFGRCDAADLEKIAAWSESLGSGAIRTAPWRAIAIPNLDPRGADALLAKAAAAGFVVEPGDARLSISACAGSPGCTSAQAPTLEDAARLAPVLERLSAGMTVHVSGCAKGCARRTAADLTLVGDAGEYGVVLGGRPGDPPQARLRLEEILARLSAGAFPERTP
jgi:precorrin-3B synthase